MPRRVRRSILDRYLEYIVGFMVVSIFVVVFCLWVFSEQSSSNEYTRQQREREELNRYIHLHHCERTYSGGSTRDYYYRCDNGTWFSAAATQITNKRI